MDKRERIVSVILYGVFICYILFLLKLLILSRLSEQFNDPENATRIINLVPFKSILGFVSANQENIQKFAFSNVVGNILIFIPLGVYLLLLRKNKRMIAILVIIFLVSLSVEVVQGLLGIGTADIDDLILNSLGGLIGIFGYKILWLLFRNEKKVRTTVAILSVLGLPVLVYLLFMVRLRL